MWKLISASVIGTSHQRSNKPCQDFCQALQTTIRGERTTFLACADGAGSASHSDIGAASAVEAVMDAARQSLDHDALDGITRDTALGWFDSAVAAIHRKAIQLAVPPRELACTLLLAVVGERRAVFAQVGDGAIVVGRGTTYDVVFWPQQGEYANVTNFITGDTLDSHMDFSIQDAPRAISLFTDGLQHLALELASRRAHQLFFQRMFEQLASADPPEDLIAPLHSFLDSSAVNQRTDDDKSLILAFRSE